MTRRYLLLALSWLGFSSVRAEAQSPNVPAPNEDGYSLVVRAGKRLGESKAQRLSGSAFTLPLKRAYLADPACRDALALVRQAVVKGIVLPAAAESFDELAAVPLLSFYTLGRLLAVAVQIAYADKQNAAGREAVMHGLTMAHCRESFALIGALGAMAINRLVLTAALTGRDRWNEADCALFLSVARKQTAAPNAMLNALALEQHIFLNMANRWRKSPAAFVQAVEQNDEYEYDDDAEAKARRAKRYADSIRGNTRLQRKVLDEMVEIADAHYNGVRYLIQNPTGRMVMPPANGGAKKHPVALFMTE